MNRNRRYHILAWAVVFVAAAAASPFGCARAVPADPAAARIREAVEARLETGLVGLSVAAARDGRLILAEGFGRRSLAEDLPAGPDTLFAIGSITKQFTAASVLLLAQDGRLAATDRVSAYFPDLTRAGDITLLDLMNHVSGYPDYYPLDFVERRMMQPIAVDAVIDAYCRGELDFEPGTRYSYSNTGYLILGRVVEKVSGLPFAEFLSRRILEPLGLKRTRFEPDVSGPEYALGHMSFLLSPPEPAVPEAQSWIHAAGALYSTPSDLVRWNEALFGGRVLQPEFLEIMTAPRRLADGSLSNYACGLSVGRRNGETIYTHSGAVNGFYAVNWHVPSTNSSLALCSNLSAYPEVSALFQALVDIALFEPRPAEPKPAEPPPAAKPAPRGVPEIAGPPVAEQAVETFTALQAGTVDRDTLGAEFDFFLTDGKVEAAAARLKAYGAPVSVRVESVNERGGMEVSSTRLEFAAGSLRALMYRTPDGKIQQYFLQKT